MHIAINGFQHVGIPVTDLKRSELFYESLGFANVMATTFQLNGNTGYVAMMQRDDMIMELYRLPDAELAEIKTRGNGHIDHIAFDVDNVDETFIQLKAAGYNVVEAAPVFLKFWRHGCKYFNITGPDGERLEFNEVVKG
jgi:lactoylglutathione lyase